MTITRSLKPRTASLARAGLILVCLLPGGAFANAVLTSPQPGVGDFGAAAIVVPGDPTATASDPAGLTPDIVYADSLQTTASVSALESDITQCIGTCVNASASADLATGTLRLFAQAAFETDLAQALL